MCEQRPKAFTLNLKKKGCIYFGEGERGKLNNLKALSGSLMPLYKDLIRLYIHTPLYIRRRGTFINQLA